MIDKIISGTQSIHHRLDYVINKYSKKKPGLYANLPLLLPCHKNLLWKCVFPFSVRNG